MKLKIKGEGFLSKYEIEEITEDQKIIGYELTGKRGAKYLLMPNHYNRNLFFVVKPSLSQRTLGGFTWFSNKKGYLEGVHVL